MKRFALVGIGAVLIAAAVAAGEAAPAAAITVNMGRPVQTVVEHRIHTSDQSQRETVDWALGRFEQARLVLPEIDIYIHATSAGCKGYLGLRSQSNGIDRVDVCSGARRAHTLLHELAHVWAGHNLTESDRLLFLEARGLYNWSGSETSWNKQGTEQAAEIIAWGLGGSDRLPDIARGDREATEAAFRLLTGGDHLGVVHNAAPRVLTEGTDR